MKHLKMLGLTFSNLLVIDRVESIRKHSPRFLCLCDCGNKKEIEGRHLRSGGIKSCGCKKGEYTRDALMTHGKTKTSEFGIWRGIRYRCLNEGCKEYPYYGGRGISVCERWDKSFEDFFEDMGPRPIGTSIERIDNNGNYEPSNCKWASRKEQHINRRGNVFIEIDGLTLTQSEWAEKYGISQQVIYTRLKRGWGFEQAVKTKVSHPKKRQALPL